MKTNVKKIMLGLGVALLGNFAATAQTGLQGIIVEKFYQTNAADAANVVTQAGNNGLATTLPVGSTVYRVYVDMAPGYAFVQAYGDPNHTWKITTSTTFFNDPNGAVSIGAQVTSTNVIRQNTRMIDSYLTTGGAAVGRAGILKAEDPDGSIGNTTGILANNPGGAFGAPITGVGAQDGLVAGTAANFLTPTALGLSPAADVFDQTTGGTFTMNAGSMAALGGVVGTTTTNAVLIGQFTTDGVFGFELNVQVQNTLTGVAENWVSSNPLPGEYSLASLILAPPSVSITSPANGANFVTGSNVSITANAVATGTITQVQFFVDGVSVGTDLTAPYAANYVATNGSHTITANVTDNTGAVSTSSSVVISAATNQAPTVSVSAPANAVPGQLVTFTATANDVDGTVASVTFSVGNTAIGTLNTAPFTFTWTAGAASTYAIKASATDNLGAVGISTPTNYVVSSNPAPVVAITSPAGNSSFLANTSVTITANATDANGIALVEAFVNNVSIGTSLAGGPTYTFVYTTGSVSATDVIKVVATDNAVVAATSTSSPISIQVLGAGGNPYSIGTVSVECSSSPNFCLPIIAKITSTVSNVIGYDIMLNYDATKVTPANAPVTINGAFFASGNAADAAVFTNTTTPGVMQITAYLTSTAAISWGAGVTNGTLFCVPFVKTATVTSVDSAAYSISALNESYINGVTPKPVDDGKLYTYKDVTFIGNLEFWNGNQPLGYTTAAPNNTVVVTNIYGTSSNCVTNTLVAVQPDAAGSFTYTTLNGNSIEIDRDIDALTDIQFAIQGNDVASTRSIVLNSYPTTPTIFELIAADVNIDGQVSAGDITQIRQRSIMDIPEFKQAWNYNAAGQPTLAATNPTTATGFVYSKDWVYVDQTRLSTIPYTVFTKTTVPVTPFCLALPMVLTPSPFNNLDTCATISNETYKGILLGDVDGNVLVAGTNSLNPYRSSGDKVIVDLGMAIVNGTSVEAPVTFISSSQVTSIDFSMKFDESNVTYNSIVNYSSNTDAIAHFHPILKTLKLDATKLDMSAFDANKAVASIRFETKSGVIDSDQFNSLVGYINGQAVPLEVLNKTVGLNSLTGNSSTAVNVFPNPTSGIINVTSISDATVVICDVTGKDVLFQTTVNASKTQQVNVSNLANGVYIVKVYNNDFITIKKVVLNK